MTLTNIPTKSFTFVKWFQADEKTIYLRDYQCDFFTTTGEAYMKFQFRIYIAEPIYIESVDGKKDYRAEIHWYQGKRIGKVEWKLKKYLE